MKTIKTTALLALFTSALMSLTANANPQAEVCTACHGPNGVSSDPTVPNLAGQQKAYLASQLSAFKAKTRKNALMNAVASNLSDDDIEALATFFNQQGADAAATAKADGVSTSEVLKNNALAFPAAFPKGYSQYTTVNRADNKQVRYLYINDAAMKSFKKSGTLPAQSTVVMQIHKAKLDQSGDPVVGDDGFYLKDDLAAYAVMAKEPGWGEQLPKEIRNGDWKYGFFKADKTHNPGPNMAKCMACHQPLPEQEFMFSFGDLASHSKTAAK